MQQFWDLPGPARFVDSVGSQLLATRNVVLCLPPAPPFGILDRIENSILAKKGTVQRLSAGDLPGEDPLASLSAYLLPAAPPIALPLELARHCNLNEQIILLDGINATAWQRWSRFLTEYAHACRSLPENARPRVVLCIVARGEMALLKNLPREDTALAHCYYYGVVSRSDMLLYSASLSASLKLSDLQRQVATATIYHIAQWDPALCEHLAQQKWERITNPRPILKALAHKQGWDPSGTPASWFTGSADLFGSEERIHSGYYGIRDTEREIERRLLCAQMSILLPLIEERRPFLIRDFAPFLGKCYTDEEGRQFTTEQMEISHLAHVLNRDGHPSAEVQILASMRRNLAHIRKVEVSDIERLEELLAVPTLSIGQRRPREPRLEGS